MAIPGWLAPLHNSARTIAKTSQIPEFIPIKKKTKLKKEKEKGNERVIHNVFQTGTYAAMASM